MSGAFTRPDTRAPSAFRRGDSNRNFAGVGLIAHPGVALVAIVLVTRLAIVVALVAVILLVAAALVALLLLRRLPVRLALLDGLVHGVEDTEVMFRMLEERFRRYPVAAAGRIAPELEILFEQLLRRAANADFRSIAVEDVVAVEWNSAAGMMAYCAARSTTTATTATRTMIAATHAFHVHTIAVVLSNCRQTCGANG